MQLEEILVEERLVEEEGALEATRLAEAEGRPLAQVFVEDFGVAEDALADAVARAIGSVVMEVQLGALDGESVRLIPEEDARRHLMVAVARGPGGGLLRVAFANPLDGPAVAAVREITGLEVEPMVATVSGLKATIDREYSRRSTQVIRPGARSPGGEMKDEVTQQIASPARAGSPDTGVEAGSGTAPMHRLEQEATVEQRHEALLLSLVEAGVLTRADYMAALQRLLGRVKS